MVGRRRTAARNRAVRTHALTAATLRLVRSELSAERELAALLADRETDRAQAHRQAVTRLRALAVRLQLDAGDDRRAVVLAALDDIDAAISGLSAADGSEPTEPPVADLIAELRTLTVDAAAAAELRPTLSVSGPVDEIPPLVVRQVHAALRSALVDVLHRASADVPPPSRSRPSPAAGTVAVGVTAGANGVTLTVADEGGSGPFVPPAPGDDRANRLGGWCVRHATPSGGAVVWHVPYRHPADPDPLAPDGPSADAVATAIGELTARLAVTRGADRLAVAGDALRAISGGDDYTVLVAVDAGRQYEVVRASAFGAGSADSAADPVGRLVPADRSVPGHAVRTGRALRIASVTDVPEPVRHFTTLPIGPALVVPIRVVSGPAVVAVTRAPGCAAFTAPDEDAAVTLAAVASAVLELQPVQELIDTWPAAEFDYTASTLGRGFPYAVTPPAATGTRPVGVGDGTP